ARNGELPAPINIQVEGNKLEQARDIAEKIKRYAETVRGAVDVRIQQRLDAPQINIDVDRVKAAQVGLTQEEIVKNVVTALNSSINFAPSFWIDEKKATIISSVRNIARTTSSRSTRSSTFRSRVKISRRQSRCALSRNFRAARGTPKLIISTSPA